jgi:hypothetical protein
MAGSVTAAASGGRRRRRIDEHLFRRPSHVAILFGLVARNDRLAGVGFADLAVLDSDNGVPRIAFDSRIGGAARIAAIVGVGGTAGRGGIGAAVARLFRCGGLVGLAGTGYLRLRQRFGWGGGAVEQIGERGVRLLRLGIGKAAAAGRFGAGGEGGLHFGRDAGHGKPRRETVTVKQVQSPGQRFFGIYYMISIYWL